jgi:glutamate-1-semialdehyde aminotransferase
VLDTVADGRVLNEIEERGRRMLDGIGSRISKRGVDDRVTVGGEPHRSVMSFVGDDPLIDKSWVQQCLAERGVLFNGSMFICARHSDADVDRALDAMEEAFAAIEAGEDVRRLLKGPPVQPVFRTQ